MEREDKQKRTRWGKKIDSQEMEIPKKKKEYKYFVKHSIKAPVHFSDDVLHQARKKRQIYRTFRGYLHNNSLKSEYLPFLKQSAKQTMNLNLTFALSNQDEQRQDYAKLRQVLKRHRCLRNIHFSIEHGPNKQGLKDLSDSLKRLCNIQSFILDFNSASMLQGLGRCFKRIHRLKSVTVNFQQTSVEGLQQFSKGFKRLSFLEDINFSFGWFQSKIFQGLGPGLKGMCSRPHVNLGFEGILLNSRDVEDVKLALKEVAFIQNLGFEFKSQVNDQGLQVLIQSFNTLQVKRLTIDLTGGPSPATTESFIESLGKLSDLEKLKLAFVAENEINKQDMSRLSQALSKLPSLKDLNLDLSHWSRISDEDLKILSQAFEKLASLKNVTMIFPPLNELAIGRFRVLKNGLRKARNLERTRLVFLEGFLNVDDEDVQQFIESLEELNSLTDLALAFHDLPNLTGKALNSIGESLKEMPCIQSVKLRFFRCENVSERDVIGLFKKMEGFKIKLDCIHNGRIFVNKMT